ncbi:hypothetical protein SECTIM467_47 [Brevibacillus phage SecTim467]|uniref:Uncharacterized protein n=2 Tax=Jenstvirus jenst TaxID=1982225 RepID=A0A0K2CP47_9CAUD|nr:hypothetical protein AVV11_gp144 [Brevibacillus phage Jenst]ALA07177.1 hypothetical protein JENST_47 [Brevibacillus phage Jenst]ALA07546.1 hypothetical protein SECTIM467_47 [Brevibacillus phage SecTim467]
MAGTRGIARLRGEQLNNKLIRNNHFDEASKINERYLDFEEEEEIFEASGGETEYNLVKGIARPKTVLLSINGQVQVPTIDFEFKINAQGNIVGFNFAPNTLKTTGGVPDVLYIKYKKVL